MIGKTISHYKILEKLGEGGMGVVYKAEDIKLKRSVALKFLTPKILGSQEEKNRFINEARAAAALDHSNICTIYEINEVEDYTFISMAYIDGQNLKEKIKSGPLSVAEALKITIQIADALQAAHEKGIIHRDIKSANIMVDDKCQAKIMDFGLAKLAGGAQLTKTGTTMGTVAYMSPEQAHGSTVNHQTDIWSLGVVLYEMLTGQLPFKGDFEQAVIYSILNEEPEAKIPEELEPVVNKALTKNPNERYQQMDEMLIDLKRLEMESTPLSESKFAYKKYKKKWNKRILFPVAIVIMFVSGFFLFKSYLFKKTEINRQIPIAVISFKNMTGDNSLDYLSEAIPNLLITSLEQSPHLQVVTWERLHDLLEQTGKTDVKIIDQRLGFKLCRMDGIEAVVHGMFTRAGDTFVTDVKVLDVSSERIMQSAKSRGDGVASILINQIDELSASISQIVGIAKSKIAATQRPIAEVTSNSMEAYNYFLRGRSDFEKAYYEDARRFLEKAIQLDSTFATAYLYLARVYNSLGNTGDMARAYKRAKRFSNKATEKEKLYIEAVNFREIESGLQLNADLVKELTKKYPKEKRFLYDMSRYYSTYDSAIYALNKALQLDPNYGSAINGLAYLYMNLEDFEKSIHYFNKYATISPGDANPLNSIAELYLRMGKLDEALTKYKETLEVKADFFVSYWQIGYIYALTENYTDAKKWIDKFVTVAPTPGIKAEAYWWKGFYNFWIGNIDQSFIDFNKAQELANSVGNKMWKAYADWVIGWIYYEQGKFDQSRKYFKKIFDFFFKFSPGFFYGNTMGYKYHMGYVDLAQGKVDSTKAKLSDVLILIPKMAPSQQNWFKYHYDLLYAEVLLLERKPEEAIAVMNKITYKYTLKVSLGTIYTVNINLPLLKIEDVLARAYYTTGQLDKSIAEYERLIKPYPINPELAFIYPKHRYRLAKLYEEKGWTNKAIKEYKKFLEIWKDADEDLPELVDAKARLVRLQKIE